MNAESDFEILLVAPPGLEATLAEEARAAGFADAAPIAGGVTIRGGWPTVWRANLVLRGASRVLARIGSFRAMHLAQLDKRARRVPWADFLRPDVPFRVEASCTRSRIYHKGAAAQRIARAITDTVGAPEVQGSGATGQGESEDEESRGPLAVKARIDDDLCTLSIDTSGESLHKRGAKQAVAKAPMRETLAALFLRQCGFTGSEPVVDPMCGAGTFVIEAAEIAAGLAPGRARRFAFEDLATFDPAAWATLRDETGRDEAAGAATAEEAAEAAAALQARGVHFWGSDRDAGAIAMAQANAARAGVTALCSFRQHGVSELARPESMPGDGSPSEGGVPPGAPSGDGAPPGLVIVNPPFGTRVGKSKDLAPLYRALGQTLRTRFTGWRVGLVTSDPALARATGLPFAPPGPPVPHGGLKVKLYRTGLLG